MVDIKNDYIIIEPVNYYTFIDNINNFNNLIKGFYLNGKEYERIIYYDISKWLSNLKNSFKNRQDIWKQYLKDSNRCIIKINNKRFTNFKKINDYLYIYKKIKQNYILIILTQAILASPFILLHNNIKSYNTNLFLSEISELDIKRFNLNKNILYDCIFKKNIINIKIIKYLRIFDFKDGFDKTICIIKIYIEFNLFNFDYSIIKFNFIPVY
tara:strand:- start:21 stop:656 length:636 start_codon:yes stop_codon:yes gene_type:complete